MAVVSWRPTNTPRDAAAWQAQLQKIKAKARGQHSPVAVAETLSRALETDATQALAQERETFLQLKSSPQSAALRHIFFAERAAGKLPQLKGAAPQPLSEIGIIGGGTMGAGIAAACLLTGLQVVLIERDDAALAAGQDRIETILAGSLKRGLISETQREAMRTALTGASDYAALGQADLVIEAVFEDMAVKHDVFAKLDAATKPEAILASNTSYLDINEIAKATANPGRVLGLHFFSPAHIMKLLELIVTDHASPAALATGLALGKRLRKITVPAGVCDGFIGNRIMAAYRREADYMLEDGALPWEIDAAMRAFGFPMGVFEMQDMA
ncbi:MAG: 3-hydroxyacyl-CoA dehydrogenase family protein, partial [Pseudomonadota bacterium]